LVWVAAGVVVFAAFATGLGVWAQRRGPGSGKPVVFEVGEGASKAEVGQRLAASGLIHGPRWFAAYAVLVRPTVRFAPGPHYLNDGLSARELVERLGRLPSRATAHVTIPEGLNFREIAGRLDARQICPSEAFGQATFDPALLRELAIPGPSAEGYLFPATYDLAVDSEPRAVIRQLVAEARKRLLRLRSTRAEAFTRLEQTHGFREFEILTLASVVQKEAAQGEHAVVASVFFNRLTDPEFRPARMLQSDPTAGYGCLVTLKRPASCQNFAGQVTPAMVRDGDNPYNTYRHPGLPPGPIANPGEKALDAVLAPANTNYLYFVAKAGRHVFSRTFAEHRAAIEGQ